MFKATKNALGEVIELGLLLLAVGILAGIFFGANVPFFSSIVKNLIDLIKALGDSGLVGLIAIAVILWLFKKK